VVDLACAAAAACRIEEARARALGNIETQVVDKPRRRKGLLAVQCAAPDDGS